MPPHAPPEYRPADERANLEQPRASDACARGLRPREDLEHVVRGDVQVGSWTGEPLIRDLDRIDGGRDEGAPPGRDRLLEPHLIGLHEAGEPLLAAYQTGGTSRSGVVPGWRTFITTPSITVEVTDERFPGPRSDLNVAAHNMLEIFARA